MTSHAMLMIFFFIMPGVMSGLGNLLVPIQLCVPELLFPKVNNLGIARDLGDTSHGLVPSDLHHTQDGGTIWASWYSGWWYHWASWYSGWWYHLTFVEVRMVLPLSMDSSVHCPEPHSTPRRACTLLVWCLVYGILVTSLVSRTSDPHLVFGTCDGDLETLDPILSS